MKKFFSDPRIQKSFLPLSFLCIFPIWFMLLRKAEHIPTIIYILAVFALVFFCLDRVLKPWDRERTEQMRKPEKPESTDTDTDNLQ